MADAAIEPKANPKKSEEGNRDVWLSIAPVYLSSIWPEVLVSKAVSSIEMYDREMRDDWTRWPWKMI